MASDDETRVFTPQSVTSAPELLIGTVLAGRYRILELLGIGAMGAVYLGQHLKIGRRDAIKVLHASMARDPDAIARFDRGARNVGAIRHPNVCTIYDFSDTDDGLQYLAMEFVSGESLKDLMDREGALPLARSVRIVEQTASALQAAHNAGVVHRDLKPANIMIAQGPDGEDAVKVVDFDISKGSQDEVKVEVTRLGFVVGTPEYMSPEQLCDGPLDGRSDVYSLALVLYRMLTGGLPFRGDTIQDLMTARLTDTPILRLDEIAPGRSFPPSVQVVLKGALERRADDRTKSAAEFAAQLREAIAVPGTVVSTPSLLSSPATHVTPTASIPKEHRRGGKRMAMIAGGVGLLAVIAFAMSRTRSAGVADQAAQQPMDSAAAASGGLEPAARLAQPAAAFPSPTGQGESPAQVTPALTARVQPAQGAPASGQPAVTVAAANVRVPAAAVKTTGIGAERASAVLAAQRERLLVSPFPDAALLTAMRDTAAKLYETNGLDQNQQALAAYLAASMSLSLGQSDPCMTWATRARDRAPTNRSYVRMATSCQSVGQ